MLVEILADKVESLCGHRPNDDVTAEFIASSLFPDAQQQFKPPVVVTPGPTTVGLEEPWTHRSPLAFLFNGRRFEVRTFKDVLVKLCQVLVGAHGQEFRQVLRLRGRRNSYFSEEYEGIREPREIEGTGIYAETNLSANAIRDRCRVLLELFRYSSDALRVELR